MPTRSHDHECINCGATLGEGSERYRFTVRRYEPMQPGPDWDAVGDWVEDHTSRTNGFRGMTLCAHCIEDITRQVYSRELSRAAHTTEAR